MHNDCCGVSTESGSDRVTILEFSILAISGDPVATALGTDLILKLRHHPKMMKMGARYVQFEFRSVNGFPS